MKRALNAKSGYSSHLDLFQQPESDVSNTNSLFIPVYSLTNIRESDVPLEFNVSNLNVKRFNSKTYLHSFV